MDFPIDDSPTPMVSAFSPSQVDPDSPSHFWLAPLLLAALGLRLFFFGGLVGWDDIGYRGEARALANGEFFPSSMFSLRHGLILPLALAQVLLGDSEETAALVPLIYSFSGLVVAYALGVIYGGSRLGLIAVALLTVLPLEVTAATDLHADLPASVFMAAAVLCATLADMKNSYRRALLLAAGVMAALAYLTKDTSLVILPVLLCLHWWRGQLSSEKGWLVVGFVVIVLADMTWLYGLTGHPFYRHSPSVTQAHFAQIETTPISPGWACDFISMLLDPFHASFGYFAGIFFLVLAGTALGLSRGDRRVGEFVLWWAGILTIMSVAPADPQFSRPLFFHFARTLHPLLIPFALTAGMWLLTESWPGRRWKSGTLLIYLGIASAAVWALNFDHRLWASVARQAAPIIRQYPRGTFVLTDATSRDILRNLLPERQEEIISRDTSRAGGTAVLLWRDPYFLKTERAYGRSVPHWVQTPPLDALTLAMFVRPQRTSLRAFALSALPYSGSGRRTSSMPIGELAREATLLLLPPRAVEDGGIAVEETASRQTSSAVAVR